MHKSRSTRSKYTPEVGAAKQQLYREAHKRLSRAIKNGFHIEAIAITESIMSDRIESAISTITGLGVEIGTLGKLISAFHELHPIDEEFRIELREWNRARGQVIHQMVKLTNEHQATWRERMTFARHTAIQGEVLLKKLRKVTDKVIREGRKQRTVTSLPVTPKALKK
jgi:hypothetical protein